jgi:hypothetical protein
VETAWALVFRTTAGLRIADCGLRRFHSVLNDVSLPWGFKARQVFSQSAILAQVIAKPREFSLDSVAA